MHRMHTQILCDQRRIGWGAHQAFRQLSDICVSKTERILDKNMDAEHYCHNLGRHGDSLVRNLHGKTDSFSPNWPVPIHGLRQVWTCVSRITKSWIKRLERTCKLLPQVQGAYRMSGDLDYLLRAVVRDIQDYDRLYQELIELLEPSDVSASFVMEKIVDHTRLPI